MAEVAALQSEANELALERYRIIAPHLDAERTLRSISLEAGVPYRTVQRWVERYRKSGFAALARQARSDQGGTRAFTPRMIATIEGLALERPPLPMSAIFRQAKRFAEGIGEVAPSYPAVHRIVKRLPEALMTLAHQGEKTYGEHFDLVHRREASHSNAVWQADHAQLNILLLREDGCSARPWLTVVIDDYSRAVAGYYLAFEPPSSLRTCLALRQGIWRKENPHWQICGIPEVLYTDNGSDFTSKRMEQVAAALRMHLIFSTPGKPQGRGRVERFFRSVNEMFLSDLTGFVRRGKPKARFTLDQLDELFRTFLIEVYHRRPGSDGRLPPARRWEEGGFLPRMPESLEQLDLLLMEEARARRVRKDGVHFHRLRYVSLTLAAYVGEEVNIRFDPRDMGEIRVFYKTAFLCRAISAELAGDAVPLRDIVRARNRRRRELRTILQNRKEAVDVLLDLRRGSSLSAQTEEAHAKTAAAEPAVRIKRYRNE